MQGFFGDMVELMPDPNGTVRSELQQCYSQMLQSEAAMPQQPIHGHMQQPGQIPEPRSDNTGGAVGVGAPGLLPGQDPLDQLRAFMGQQQRQVAPAASSAQQAAQLSQAQRTQTLQQQQQQRPQQQQQQPMPQLPAIYDAVVVGAGAAGIAAATSLRDNGLTVLVLEARDRVGGRVHSQACAGLSTPVDLGSDILYGGRDQKHLLSRAQLLHERFRSVKLLDSTVIFDEEENQLSGKSQHDAVMKHTANQNAEMHASLVQYSGQPQLGDMAVEEALESKYKECCSGWGPSMGGLRQRVLDWRLHSWHLADYRLRAKKEGLSARRWMSSDDCPNNDIFFTGGFGNVMQKLAEPLDVRLSTIVEHVKYEGKPSAAQLLRSGGSNGPTSDVEPLVKIRCRGGAEFTGRFCVITVPLGVLKAGRIAFSPPLPPRKTEAMSRLGTGALNKVVLHFHTAFWEQTVGQSHIGVVSTSADQHAWYYNASAATNSPVLIAVLYGDAARAAEVSSDSQVVTRAVRSLQLAFRPVHVPEPVASHVTRWGSDPFAQGGYSFFATSSSAADCEAMAEPCGWRKHHLGFAGEATTAANMGTVLGAWCSGEAEALRVLKEMEAPMRSADGSSGGGAGDLVRQGSSGAPPVSLPRANSGSELPPGLEPIDEKERREREAFIGRGAGAKPEGCTSIFVGNLPYNVSQQAVADIFRPIGGRRNIVRVSVKQGKGFAHVEFNLTSCVDKAFEYLQGVKFMGRRIRLDYANKAKAAGPPSREENLARQQQQALAAKAAAAAGGGASGAGRQISAPANSNSGADSKAASSPAADLDDGDMCPLCCEPLDKTDQSFEPCDCGYQICLWCFHRIHDQGDGLCPACRSPYGGEKEGKGGEGSDSSDVSDDSDSD